MSLSVYRSIKRLIAKYVVFAYRKSGFILALFLLAAFISLLIGSRLELRSDIKEILPPNSESVRSLNDVLGRVGGMGLLVVAVEGKNVSANKKFMDDFYVKLQQYPEGFIKSISYKVDNIEDFYKRYALYYLSLPELRKLRSKVENRVQYEKIKLTPLFLDLMEDDDDPIFSEIEKIKKESEGGGRYPLSVIDGYYAGEWGNLFVMLIRPYGENLSVDGARGFVSMIQRTVRELDPGSYDSQLKVGYCGNVVSTVEEYFTLRNDVFKTALLCLLLVGGVVTLYYLRIRVFVFLAVNLLVAISFTSMLVYIVIGYLNVQTAFLGTIIVGTGINYGIIIIARYLEERKKSLRPKGAMTRAVSESMLPTFLGAATTAVSFAILGVAGIRGLSQFGFIGSSGVLLCWITTIFFLPPLVLYFERIGGMVKSPVNQPRKGSLFIQALLTRATKSAPFIVSAAVLTAVISSLVVFKYAPDAIEYDFTKMRNKSSVVSGTEALEKRVGALFKGSMTPAVAIVDDVKAGDLLCRDVNLFKSSISVDDVRIGDCNSINDAMPSPFEDSLHKSDEIRKIRSTISGSWKYKIKDSLRKQLDEAEELLVTTPPTIADLPREVSDIFTDLNGKRGAVVYINPRADTLLSDGRNLIKFAEQIDIVRKSNGEAVIASESLIFADIVRIIKQESPILTIASMVGVVSVIFLMLYRTSYSLVIVFGLMWAISSMLAICAIAGMKINFFNFIVLPLTFGVGADYGINVALRLKNNRKDSLGVLKYTGGAVMLCSLTTIIGYYVLTRATNQALASFGVAAVIGELCCLFSAVVVIPAFISFVKRIKKRC